MSILLGILGLVLLVFGIYDLLWTTFLEGAGPLTKRLGMRIGRGMLWIHLRSTNRQTISRTGLAIVCSALLLWGAMIWFGWALVFNFSPNAVVATDTHVPGDFWARVYFAGYTVTTVGLGDYKPLGAFWQMVVAMAGGSGFILFGLAIAYLVPVVQAVTAKRQLAVTIWSLGRTPSDIIIRAWNGVDATALGPHLVQLTGMLALLGESHLTWPVLHYFHSIKRSSALASSVASLDEALTILECGLQKGCSLDLPALGAARESITVFLQTLEQALIDPAKDVPPSPSLKELRESGVPVVDDSLFEAALVGLAERRKLLLALVHNEGWTWQAVWPKETATLNVLTSGT